jgi:phage shock protein A
MTAHQLLDQARRHEADAHRTYDSADAALNAGRQRLARELYARGESLEAAADLFRQEAAEV